MNRTLPLPALICASALATLVAVLGAPESAAEILPPRHERASTWRTVIIPAPADSAHAPPATLLSPPRPAVRPAPRPPLIETAALHKPASAPPAVMPKLLGPGHALDGIASYYWQDQMTASGERFDKRAMTAAHRTLPMGTRVRVTHVASGRSVVVRINDRGPFKKGRVIDLSEAAAQSLDMTGKGLAHVRIDVIASR